MTDNSVHRKEMKETWDETINELHKVQNLLERPYKYSNWITNLSFGLLGFYIAFLIQLKNNGAFESKIEVILTLLIIVAPIVMGVIFRIKHEVIDIYNSFRLLFGQIDKFQKEVNKKFEEKQKTKTKTEDANTSIDFQSDKIEKWYKRPPLKGLYCQLIIFCLGVIWVISDVLSYLFS